MPYVRVNKVEFKRKEDMQKDMESLHNNMKSIFPEMRLFIAMEASETSKHQGNANPPIPGRRTPTICKTD